MTANLKRTPLYAEHLKLQAKMVPFAGWEMPVQYLQGVIEEHRFVREKAGIFDVGHMGVVKCNNTEKLLANQCQVLLRPIDNIKQGRIKYNRIINKTEGVVDDILVYRDHENFLAVFNASNVEKDIKFFKEHDIDFELMGLHIISLQGPQSEEILKRLTREELDKIPYYGFIATELEDEIDCIISRTGYTGESGFEIMLAPESCAVIWNLLVSEGALPIGLGARDTLRLEAGLPLYGHELKDEWSSLKSDTIVGLKMLERGVPRQGYLLFDAENKEIGEITSGTFSPSLNEPIALALVENKVLGDEVFVEIRDKKVKAIITQLPFVNKLHVK